MESCNYDFVFLLLTHSCAIVFRVCSVSVVLSNSALGIFLVPEVRYSYGRVPVQCMQWFLAVLPSSSSRFFTKFHSSSSSILVSFAGSHFELPNTTTTRTLPGLTHSSLNQLPLSINNRQHNILLRASIRSSNSNTGTSNRPHLILSRDQNKRLAYM